MTEQLATIQTLSETLGKILLTRSWSVAVAESCTGGSLCAALTDIPGCSAWFDRGFITYSNDAKETLLMVPSTTLSTQGAVSEETALAMADGALKNSRANVSLSITGLAGPTGGSKHKPVGTVWIACAGAGLPTQAKHYFFQGNRQAIRHQSVFMALQRVIKQCSREP
jgi:nicotinamide-nucleotide amidase